MTTPNPPSPEAIRKGRRTLFLLLAVSAAPVVAAWFAFFIWHPQKTAVNGQLVTPPVALNLQTEAFSDGAALSQTLNGQWVLAVKSGPVCEARCKAALYYARQVRTLQAKEMDRVTRLWVIDAPSATPDPALLQEHPDLHWVASPTLAAKLGASEEILIIDRRGNLMLRYPATAEPQTQAKGIVKDLQKLLKYAR